jgi:hypothetical protein
MSSNGVIIGSFVRKERILSFLEMLRNDFKVRLEKVFIYDVDSNKHEYLVSFKTFDKDKFIGKLQNSTVMHVKNGCLFSINALNKLISSIKDDETPNNEFILDWDKYKDKLIIQTNGELTVSNLTKIEDKLIFFN